MKKPLKTILVILAVLVLAGLLCGEIMFYLHMKDKNDKLDARVLELEAELDKANEKIDGLEKSAKEAFDEEKLVESIKNAFEKHMEYSEELLEDVKSIDDLIAVFFDTKWEEEIHEIWDDTAVVEAYRSGISDGLSEEDLYVLETASAIIDEITDDGMTDYEKELAVYNWQVKYVQYDEEHFSPLPVEDEEEYNYYPYGVLKYHSAICVGNATTFKLFMDMLGIDCRIIHSTEEGEHAWNLVCLDGDWYHVDVTFDSGYGEPDYAYFNVPDSFKLDGGYPWDRDEFPAAEGFKYCYCFNNAAEAESLDGIMQLIQDTLDNGGGTVLVKSKSYISGVENAVERFSEEISDNAWAWLEQDGAEVGGYYLYQIGVETADEEFWEEMQ
ncbi:MAG: hypothetical protein NC223_08865 [Butyrivibrio sp.]|nr:hypothetical protein [Butyrivibrio sp.]